MLRFLLLQCVVFFQVWRKFLMRLGLINFHVWATLLNKYMINFTKYLYICVVGFQLRHYFENVVFIFLLMFIDRKRSDSDA